MEELYWIAKRQTSCKILRQVWSSLLNGRKLATFLSQVWLCLLNGGELEMGNIYQPGLVVTNMRDPRLHKPSAVFYIGRVLYGSSGTFLSISLRAAQLEKYSVILSYPVGLDWSWLPLHILVQSSKNWVHSRQHQGLDEPGTHQRRAESKNPMFYKYSFFTVTPRQKLAFNPMQCRVSPIGNGENLLQ